MSICLTYYNTTDCSGVPLVERTCTASTDSSYGVCTSRDDFGSTSLLLVPADYNSFLLGIDCRGIGYSVYASSDCTGEFTFVTLGEYYTNAMLVLFNATTPGEATIEAAAAIDFSTTPGCKNVEGSANSYTLDFGDECSSTSVDSAASLSGVVAFAMAAAGLAMN